MDASPYCRVFSSYLSIPNVRCIRSECPRFYTLLSGSGVFWLVMEFYKNFISTFSLYVFHPCMHHHFSRLIASRHTFYLQQCVYLFSTRLRSSMTSFSPDSNRRASLQCGEPVSLLIRPPPLFLCTAAWC